MAVRPTGELTFSALGSNVVMVFDFNAICEIEDEFDMSVSELQDTLQAPRMKMIRSIFRIGLSRHHPDITDRKAGEIIGDIGIQRAAGLIGEAFSAAFPQAEATGTTEARPPASA
ncbi:hypothetical protein [Acuticoccus sediminis]|uniref:hypothetical protein n=1 Tax=Acuticoccus sediminis TaxID=2184697 RepID=UPI001CFF101F|nr:hypothetical protein [Acuticoccus sediminis]